MTAVDEATVDLEWQESERGAIARLSYRERRLNLVGSAGLRALHAAMDQAEGREDARVVVLSGAGGRAFVGGADIAEMVDLDPPRARRFISDLHQACDRIRSSPLPVVARIEGYCLGAGLELAACCDLRLAARDARFGMPEVRVGIPSVIEAALLPRLIGLGRAQDLVLTGRLVDAEEALRIGLVDGVADAGAALEALVDERVGELLAGGRRALAAQKELIRRWQELPLSAAIEAGVDAFARSWETPEPREAMRRFLERRR
ncbi:MAG TPA: enoyl-CoA hydratase [Thermoanaerobaculia bacterium]|nr:enoyl-CoA hydratase [Thermoanaerobaculia bacterium]